MTVGFKIDIIGRMSIKSKYFFLFKVFAVILLGSAVFLGVPSGFWPETEAESTFPTDFSDLPEDLLVIQENSLQSLSSPLSPEPEVIRTIKVVITAYSSTLWETDDTPHITAAGTWVRDGIVANNYLPFGTKVKIPELYGDKIFVIEDRMSWKKGNYHFDIWFPSYQEALDFGAKRTYIEVLEG